MPRGCVSDTREPGRRMSRGRARLRRFSADQDAASVLARVALEHRRGKLISRRSADGDPIRLRGIPVQGARGVGGTQLGSRPGAFIDRIRDDD